MLKIWCASIAMMVYAGVWSSVSTAQPAHQRVGLYLAIAGGLNHQEDQKFSSANSSGKGSLDEAYARLQATEASLERLEPLGKSDLAAIVLPGNTADFPNRAQWEDKLYSAKETYIERSRKLLEAMSQVLANMEALQSNGQEKVSSNDPRVQSLIRKTKQIMQLAAQTEAAFQSVISEGQNLALQPAPR